MLPGKDVPSDEQMRSGEAVLSGQERLAWVTLARTPALDVATLTGLLQEAEKHHGEYEPTAPKHQWSDWYAAYIIARQDGKTPEEAARDGKIHVEGAR